MKQQKTYLAVIGKPCSCGNSPILTDRFEENELGLWYDCPTCHSTGLIAEPKVEMHLCQSLLTAQPKE